MQQNISLVVKFGMFVKYLGMFVNNILCVRNILILLLLAITVAVTAKSYYVATPTNGGNDLNDGLDSVHVSGLHGPWASWEKAFTSASVQPGDTVFIRGGVYYTTVKNGTGIKLTRNGTSDNWIVYTNYPGEKPIMDCSKITAKDIQYTGLRNDGISTNGIRYVKLIGLTIRNVKQYYNRNYARGFYLPDGIVNLENCTAYNIWGHGIHSQFSVAAKEDDTHYIINCDSYNNCDSISGDPLGSNAGATGAGFDAWTDGINGKTYFINCRAWGNSDQGYSIGSDAYVKAVGCWSFANKAYVAGGGAGYKLGWQDIDVPFLRREIINCVATFNDGYGFLTNERGSGSTYYAVKSNHYNNIAYHNGYTKTSDGFGFIIQDTEQAEIIEQWRNYSNNIDYDNYRKYTYTAEGLAKYSGSNNSWDIPLTLTDADFVSLDTTGITAPRQADGSLPDNNCYRNFLRLSEGSQAIDKGIDVGLKYYGTAPDLGPFEYVSRSSNPPEPPVYLGSVIENATPSRLDMTYNLTLAKIIPTASAFSVRVNSTARSVSSVVVSGTKVQLTLSSPVVYGDVVTVAYIKPATNPLQTAAGGQVASMSARSVVNNCTMPENQPPIVSLSSPTKSNSFIAPATITIDATASDPDGSIIKVEFYQGNVKIGEKTSLPYTITWKEVPEGNYSLTAVATDNYNLKTTSSAVIVVVEKSSNAINMLPIVAITSPKKDKKHKKNDKIKIEAIATDPDGSIAKVEFKSGSIILAELTTSPYVYIWDATEVGNSIITVTATDNLGASSSEKLVLFVDPSVDMNPDNITIYPNPNDGHFKIEIGPEISDEDYLIKIINLAGQTICHKKITGQESAGEYDLSSSPSGTYVIMVSSDNNIRTTKKFIKN